MAVSSTDLTLRASSVAGSAGGSMSATSITSGVDNNVFPDITSVERLAGGERFRKVFIRNGNGTDSMLKPVVYTPVVPTSAQIQIGVGIDSVDDSDGQQGNMTNFAANANVALISDGADVRTATIYGLDNSGTPVPTTENVVLTNAVEVLSTKIWTKVYAVHLSAINASRIVTVKQGSGGSTRGTIGLSKRGCWLWLTNPNLKTSGIALPDLVAGGAIGVWQRLSWIAGAAVVRPSGVTLSVEENA